MRRGDAEFLRRCRAVHILNQAYVQVVEGAGGKVTKGWVEKTAKAESNFSVAQLRMVEADLAEYTKDFTPEYIAAIEAVAQKQNCSIRAIIDRREQAIKRYLKRGSLKTEDEARIAMGVLADLEYDISGEDRATLESVMAKFEQTIVGKANG